MDYIVHSGVKGMKWGVRKAQGIAIERRGKMDRIQKKYGRRINVNNAISNLLYKKSMKYMTKSNKAKTLEKAEKLQNKGRKYGIASVSFNKRATKLETKRERKLDNLKTLKLKDIMGGPISLNKALNLTPSEWMAVEKEYKRMMTT